MQVDERLSALLNTHAKLKSFEIETQYNGMFHVYTHIEVCNTNCVTNLDKAVIISIEPSQTVEYITKGTEILTYLLKLQLLKNSKISAIILEEFLRSNS